MEVWYNEASAADHIRQLKQHHKAPEEWLPARLQRSAYYIRRRSTHWPEFAHIIRISYNKIGNYYHEITSIKA